MLWQCQGAAEGWSFLGGSPLCMPQAPAGSAGHQEVRHDSQGHEHWSSSLFSGSFCGHWEVTHASEAGITLQIHRPHCPLPEGVSCRYAPEQRPKSSAVLFRQRTLTVLRLETSNALKQDTAS